MQRIDFSTASPAWIDALGCDPTLTQCTVATPTSTEYGYRVKALNTDHPTGWFSLGVFVSKPDEDGYVQSNMVAMPHATEPGIRAGRGSGTMQLRGILSFNTGVLGSTAKVQGAKLRLKQTTDNAGFDSLGPCKVDIINGAFNHNVALEGADYSYASTDPDVMRIMPLGPMQTAPDWTVTDLRSGFVDDINNTTTIDLGRTQLRLYFDGTTANQQVRWNSGDSPGNEPYLLVQYTQ